MACVQRDDSSQQDGAAGTPLKVSYVFMEFPKPSETFALQDLRELARQGVRVTAHALRPAGTHGAERMLSARDRAEIGIFPATLRAQLAGLREIAVRPGRAFRLLVWGIRSGGRPLDRVKSVLLMPRALGILAEIETARPDVVHLFWGHFPALVGHLVQSERPGVVSSMFLGAFDLAAGYGGTGPVARRADVVWTHARVNAPALRELGVAPERIHVAYRGVDLARIARVTAGIAPDPDRIAAAGRLIPAKGFDTLLRAFARVHAHLPSARLVILGEGPDRRRLEALAERLGVRDGVVFRGHVDHDDNLRELAGAAVTALLSRKPSERLPNVIKEAMAIGRACVASRTPGMDELIPGPEHGRIVAIDDEAAAAGALQELLEDGALRDSISHRAREHIHQNFDLRVCMARHVEHWSALRERVADAGR